MILTVDIGNRVITIGGFDKDTLSFVSRISTSLIKTDDEYAIGILDVLKLYGVDKNQIEGAIVASVVPPLNSVVKKALQLILLHRLSRSEFNAYRCELFQNLKLF